MAVACLVLWLELVVRAAAVSVAALFLPLALAGLVWPAVSHWCRRLADTLAALVLSKLVVAATLSLAVGAVAGGLGVGATGGDGGGFAAVITGIALLAIATFSPFTLLKLIPAIESGVVSHLESTRHRLSSAAHAPMRARNMALDIVRDAGSGDGSGNGSGGEAGAGGGAGVAGSAAGSAVGSVAGSAAGGAAGSTAGGAIGGGGSSVGRVVGSDSPVIEQVQGTVLVEPDPADAPDTADEGAAGSKAGGAALSGKGEAEDSRQTGTGFAGTAGEGGSGRPSDRQGRRGR